MLESTQRQIMKEIWGPGMESETSYLRAVYRVDQKIEKDPSRLKSYNRTGSWIPLRYRINGIIPDVRE